MLCGRRRNNRADSNNDVPSTECQACSYRLVELRFGYREQPQNFPRRPLTSRILDLHLSQMTSGREGGPDIGGSGANDAVSNRAMVMSLVTVCPFSQTPDVGASPTDSVKTTPHSRHMT